MRLLRVFVGDVGSAYMHNTDMVKARPTQPFVKWDTVVGMWPR